MNINKLRPAYFASLYKLVSCTLHVHGRVASTCIIICRNIIAYNFRPPLFAATTALRIGRVNVSVSL